MQTSFVTYYLKLKDAY